jgi:3-keto-disaccharide hydrolase
MKAKISPLALVVAVLLLATTGCKQQEDNSKSSAPNPADSAAAYLGRRDLTLKAPDRESPSWLELTEENGQLEAQMVGRWGNARPLPKVEIANGRLRFVSPKEEEGRNDDMVFEGILNGDTLAGNTTGPDGAGWSWTGVKAPSLQDSGTPKWGEPIVLFNGKDLTGWTMSKSDAKTVWKVENGKLITPGNGPELINDSKFKDFKMHVEFNSAPEANSGVYLRGRYEVQIETDSAAETPSHHTGAVYGFLAPSPELPRKPGEWQTFDITLVGRNVTVVQNGQTVINHQEIPGITGGALASHEELPGPIYLQGSEKGHVAFREIVLTPAEP